MRIIIPARLGSKGLPFKNRQLFKYTADTIPEERRANVIVTTDDAIISAIAKDYGFFVLRRPDSLGEDTTSTRDVLLHAIKECNIGPDEFIVTLYLTYPERTWEDIKSATDFYLTKHHEGLTDSMLCKKEIKTHPYLCLQEHGADGLFGKQIAQHDLYRRQDYPTCFEISHYISIFRAGSIYKLNRNLYCDTTVYYPIPEVVDIDLKKDFDNWKLKSV